MTAAITLKLETSPNHLPHAATPIIRRLTIWKQETMDGYTLRSVHAQKRQLWISTLKDSLIWFSNLEHNLMNLHIVISIIYGNEW